MVFIQQIKQKALALGFDLVGITDAAPLSADCLSRLLAWLDAGYAGTMTWMQNNLEKRVNPAKLLPGAKSVIVVALNYKTSQQPLSLRAQRAQRSNLNHSGLVAAYAQYEDYHPFIKKLLRQLADFIIAQTGPGFKFKICVDSAPLFERALALKAGLGFIGKNHMLINPCIGPQILLGELITNLPLVCDKHIEESCPKCDKCVESCPTGALRPDGFFDASRCISYLTIESAHEIPADIAPKIGNRLFGCCECLLVCPYHQNAPSCANSQFAHYHDHAELNLDEILNLTESQFQSKFADSPLLRAGLPRLKHIAKICLNNLSNS